MADTESADSTGFYRNLPPLASFEEATDPSNLTPLPEDWSFFVADIVDSTRLLEEGGYRKVNQTAAAAITAVLNAIGKEAIPYVFGGDGAQLAVPPQHRQAALTALQGVSGRVKQFYGIHLRIAGFRIDILRKNGFEILSGKLMLSPEIDQAVFWGNGLDHIEQWIRQGEWALDIPDEVPEPDLSGLECRWKEIPGKHEEIISLLIQVAPGREDASLIYRNVLGWVAEAFGPESERHPLSKEDLDLLTRADEQRLEVDFRNFEKPAWQRKIQAAWNALENKVGLYLMKTGKRFLGVDWAAYFDGVLKFGDHQKFSGMLALTSSTSTEKREALEEKLASAHEAGHLAYGLNRTHRVIITCMVMDRSKHHRHFVDGYGNGYTQASRQLKKQLASLSA
jgi:hypothetical protein